MVLAKGGWARSIWPVSSHFCATDTESITTVHSIHAIMRDNGINMVTKGMMTQSNGRMMQSYGTVRGHGDASECGSECGASDHQALKLSEKGDYCPSDDHHPEQLDQPEKHEQCKQAIAHKIPRIDFSQLRTSFVSSFAECDLQDANQSSFTPQKGRADSSLAASLCEGNNLIAAIGSTWTQNSTCAVCGSELGKRKLRPRHHCRVCWNSVCANCSPSFVQLIGEKVPQRVCNPCTLNAQTGPALRERVDHLSDQLSIISGSRGPLDGKAITLQDAVWKCESILPALDRQIDNHACTKEELQEVKTMYAVAETHATEADIQVNQLREELQVLRAELREAKVNSEHLSRKPACKRSQIRLTRMWQQASVDCIDGFLF